MSEKMKQDQIMLNAIAEIMRGTDCKFSTEMIDLVESLASASSPAQETVTTEPVAWQRWTKIGLINMTSSRSEAESWRTKGADVRPLYAIPAPPQPGREWREWRQIETVPKNGTFVDLLFRGNVRIADCIWYRDAWWATEQRDPSVCVSHGLAQPTHWMPIPMPAALTGALK